jgi:hypothetical protein
MMPRKTKEPKVELHLLPGEGIFVLMDGKRIAKRLTGKWIPLEPGIEVYSPPDISTITIEINGVRVH